MGNITTRSKLIIKQLILNINYIFSSVSKIFSILAIVLLALLLPIIFVPIRFAVALVLYLGALLPASIIYVSTNFNFRKSTLYINQSTTNSSRINFYISSLMLFIIVTYSLTIFIYFVLLLFQELDLLLYDWAKYPSDSDIYTLQKINFIWLMYTVGELALTTFALLFFCQSIMKSERTIYIIILGISILSIIYGGTFNNYFSKGRIYSGNNAFMFYNSSSMLGYLFYPSLIIFPFFAPMQHMAGLKWGMCKEYDFMVVHLLQWQKDDLYVLNGISPEDAKGLAMHWNILYFMPYIHVLALGGSGVIISKYKRSH